MNIHESAEDYLEAILILRERQGLCAPLTWSASWSSTKPQRRSGHEAFGRTGYIEMDGDGFITLLRPVRKIAQRIYSRHKAADPVFNAPGRERGDGLRRRVQNGARLSDETFEKIRPTPEA